MVEKALDKDGQGIFSKHQNARFVARTFCSALCFFLVGGDIERLEAGPAQPCPGPRALCAIFRGTRQHEKLHITFAKV